MVMRKLETKTLLKMNSSMGTSLLTISFENQKTKKMGFFQAVAVTLKLWKPSPMRLMA